MLFQLLSILIVSCLAIGLDKTFSEVKRFHPLVGFGNYVSFIEKKLNNRNKNSKYLGTVSWMLSIFPFVFIIIFLQYVISSYNFYFLSITFDAVILYFAVGRSSLSVHAMNIYKPLSQGNEEGLKVARKQVSMMVSRETQNLNEKEISRATVESVLENGHDAVMASLFWYAVGGAPFVILHRLANTLDAMWGYKNERFLYFGWFSARVDDWLGCPSAKITSFLFALQRLFKKRFLLALKNASMQGKQYKSLNGGWVMASGATVLNVSLGGSAIYDSRISQSVILGISVKTEQAEQVNSETILKSIRLVSNAVWIWLGIILLLNLLTFAADQYFA